MVGGWFMGKLCGPVLNGRIPECTMIGGGRAWDPLFHVEWLEAGRYSLLPTHHVR